ncbi:MAG: MotE family protein [Bdellovibrionales bacterium]
MIKPRIYLGFMVFLGVLVVGLRAGDIWQAVSSGQKFAPVQLVQAQEHAATPEKSTAAVASSAAAPTNPKVEPPDAKGSPESDLYKQLVGRRDQLDQRAKQLDEREAFVSIAEKRVDQKIKEMEVMRKQLESLLGQADAAQQAQIENLVKIYELMKPKEAAQIFETLELPVLLGVVQRMKPARTSAIMAQMNPEKAKEITVALTRRDQLPQVK